MKKKDIVIILLLFVCALPSLFPLLHHGFFQTDDGEWMIIRLSAFYQAFHDGQFPVRFLQRLNFGYGYPVAQFLYPGGFYFGSLLHVLRFGFVDAIKIIFGLSLFGSALFSYFWLQQLFSKFASFIGALFALYLPYHLYDLYKRGSIEVFALLWVPFVLWQIERKSIFWTSVGISLLLISHNTIALLFLPLLFIYGIVRKCFSLRLLSLSFVLGILLSSFFIFPAVLELPYTVFSQTAVSNPLLYFADLQLIGYAVFFVLILTFIAFFYKNKLFEKKKNLVILFFFVSLLTLILSTQISSLFWHMRAAAFIQFPFRFLSYLTISGAFLVSFLVGSLNKWKQWLLAIIFVCLLFFSALPYFQPAAYFDKGEGYYYTNDATTTVQDEYMPIWVKQKQLQRPEQQVEIKTDNGAIRNISSKSDKMSFDAQIRQPSQIQFNTIYWPGWHATLDGKEVTISDTNPKGIMIVTVPQGMHHVEFTFGEDIIRLVADVVSFLALFFLLFFESRRKAMAK